jgi:hypothetical protein
VPSVWFSVCVWVSSWLVVSLALEIFDAVNVEATAMSDSGGRDAAGSCRDDEGETTAVSRTELVGGEERIAIASARRWDASRTPSLESLSVTVLLSLLDKVTSADAGVRSRPASWEIGLPPPLSLR